MFSGPIYHILYAFVRFILFFWHPVLKVYGRENLTKDQALILCSNHFSMSDPVWIVVAMNTGYIPRVMAKKEAQSYPVLGKVLKKIGVIFVDRGIADVQAIKDGLRCLRNGHQLLIFPEGTRVRDVSKSEPKRGALTLSNRTNTPILPVFVSRKRRPFGPMEIVFGEPYLPEYASQKATDEELEQATADLMRKIYAMEAQLCR